MKKSKFLLLGSVASMAAIPFVAAKCGGTKEENKKPAEMPGGTEQPGKPGDTDQPAQPNPGTTPSTPAKPGKTPERMAQDTDVSGADISGSIKTPDTTATKTKLSDALKTIANNNLGKVQVSKENKDKKDKEDKTGGSTSTDNKDPKSPGESESVPMESSKIDLKKLEESVKQELNMLAKKDVLSEDVLDVLKKAKGLESLRLGDLSKVEFNEKDKKLTIESHKDSKLVTGKYEFTLEK